MNKIVSASLARKGKRNPTHGQYSNYTAKERIGRYAAENGNDVIIILGPATAKIKTAKVLFSPNRKSFFPPTFPAIR